MRQDIKQLNKLLDEMWKKQIEKEIVFGPSEKDLVKLLNELLESRTNQSVILIGGGTENEKWPVIFSALLYIRRRTVFYYESLEAFRFNCKVNLNDNAHIDPFLQEFKKACSVSFYNYSKKEFSNDCDICVFFPGTHTRENDDDLSNYIATAKKLCPKNSVIIVIPTNVTDVDKYNTSAVDRIFNVKEHID